MNLQQEVNTIAQLMMNDLADKKKTPDILFDDGLSAAITAEISVNGIIMPKETLAVLKGVLAVFVVREWMATEYEKAGIVLYDASFDIKNKGTLQ